MKVAESDTSSPSKNNPPENTFICNIKARANIKIVQIDIVQREAYATFGE